ncbi:MAG: hypothetical protein IPK32_12600 [Verrucomicrobiaceae bacterium]|nr:hypothetical protein [Verrucomicrobiaceae bacterium]
MVRLLSLLLLLGMSLAWGSVALPPPFVILSDSEAAGLQKKLVEMNADDFVSHIQMPAAAGQPPFWLGPYTGTVVADAFGMMPNNKANELLVTTLSIQEATFPEEIVLFAASCFQATRNKEAHSTFAKNLEERLKKLALSPWQPHERDSGNQSELRCRAIAALFRLWQGTDADTSWLSEQAKSSAVHPDMRSCMLDQLTSLLAAGDREASPNMQDRPETLRRRQLFGSWPERAALKQQWGNKRWSDDLFIPLSKSEKEHPRVRASAIAALGALLKSQEKLRDLLRALAQNETNHSKVRSSAIYQLSKFWAGEAWFSELLFGIISSDRTGSRLASSILWLLAKELNTQPAQREQLALFTADPEKHAGLQFRVLEIMARQGKDDWLRQHLARLVNNARLDWVQRRNALRLLTQQFTRDPTVKDLNVLLAQNQQEPVPIRAEAARGLGQFVRGDAELRAKLIHIIQSGEEDEKVRLAALQSTGLVWERQNNLWVKELLMPLASPLEKSIAIRREALWSIGQIWHEAWVPKLFTSVCTADAEPGLLRMITIEALYQTGCRDEWLKQTLLKLAGKEEENEPVRGKAMWILAQIWRSETWVAESLLKIAAAPQDSAQARRDAIRTFISNYPSSQEASGMLIRIVNSPSEPSVIRSEAVSALGRHAKPDDTITALLLKQARSSETPSEVRLEAIGALGNNSTRLSWYERGMMLQSLMGSGEQDALVRQKAAYQLALIRESFLGW